MVLKWPFHTFVTFELRQTILFCFIVGDLQTKTSKNELKLKYFAFFFFILRNTRNISYNFTFNLIMSTQEILNNFYVSVKVYDLIIDLSITSTKTKYIKLNTKTQNIFCCLNENLTTFLYTWVWQGPQENKVYTKVICYQKKIWVLVFRFMYLVLVEANVEVIFLDSDFF